MARGPREPQADRAAAARESAGRVKPARKNRDRKKPKRGDLVGGVTGAVTGTVKAISIYSAFSKLAQVLPLIIGLLVVALSPTAWLSATLRRWGIGGMLVGAAAGALGYYLLSRRPSEPRRLATVAFTAMVVALALLRFHLALADVAFTERNALLRAVHDYFVGTGDFQESLYNVLAAVLFAAAVFSATIGVPALGVATVRARRAREAAAQDAAGLDAAKGTIQAELVRIFDALDVLRSENARLLDENEALRKEVLGKAAVRKAAVRNETSGKEASGKQTASVAELRDDTAGAARRGSHGGVSGAADPNDP